MQLPALTDRKNYCNLPDGAYDWFDGLRVDKHTQLGTPLMVYYRVDECDGRLVLVLINGVQGEQFYIESLLSRWDATAKAFVACSGSLGLTDRLILRPRKVKAVCEKVLSHNRYGMS